MSAPLSRRVFLRQSAAAGAGLAAASVLSRLSAAERPSNRVRVGVMGLSRGMHHVQGYLALPGVEVAYVCDVDSRRRDAGLAKVKAKQSAPCQGVTDFRRILDDPTIDAISIAAPSFWHTTAAVMACAAGKHVYVEKPGSYDPQESAWIVEAARKHNRVMQMGAQRRSNSYCIEAIERLKAGAIGRVRYAKCFYEGKRPSIGIGRHVPVPEWLDYELWQGPAPRRPYQDNVVHNKWHWFWHYDGGELSNNGVHYLDVAVWGLGVGAPKQVTCAGKRYNFKDDQQTPDTAAAIYDFGDIGINMEWSSCYPRAAEPLPFCAFYGDNGSIALCEKLDSPSGRRADVEDMSGYYTVNDLDGRERERRGAKFDDVAHFRNFVETIRGRDRLHLDIAEGQKSALLCHLGKLSIRSGRTLDYDAAKGRESLPPEARKYWTREYDPNWRPVV